MQAPRIIIAGAPASGKGTQCEFIKEEFKCVHLSTGDMLRAAVEAGSDLGKEAKGYMDSGGLVPDRLIIDIIIARLAEQDCVQRGWLLDGFPRTRAQADALAAAGLSCDIFIFLDVPDNLLVERVTGRRSDPVTGQIYHIKYKPAPSAEIAARLTQRSDDTEEAIMVRVKNFHANLAAIIDAYKPQLVHVDGARNPKIVWSELEKSIGRSSKKEVIIVTGSPGSGRSKFSEHLAKAQGYTVIHSGSALRSANGHKSKDLIDDSLSNKSLIDAQTAAEVVRDAILTSNSKKIVLDGYARSAAHVRALNELLGDAIFIDTAIHVQASPEVCRTALENRKLSEQHVKNALEQNTSTEEAHALYQAAGKLRVIRAEDAKNAEGLAQRAASFVRATRIIPPYERTFAMIKPDAVSAGHVKPILDMIAAAGLNVIFTRLVTLSDAAASAFYGEHAGKPFFPKLKQFMTSGPAMVLVLEGTDAIRTWRKLLGPTNTQKAVQDAPDSIRAKFGTDGTMNAAHGSDSPYSAAREIHFWTCPTEPGATCAEAMLPADMVASTSSTPAIPIQDTFAMIKPGTSQVAYEEVMDTIRAHGFEIREELKTQLSPAQAAAFYGEHEGKPFYERLCAYMCSGPIVALHLRKPSAISAWRHLIGPTNFEKAKNERPDSIRAKFAMDGTRNACHGSDSEASARRELAFFFSVGGAAPDLFTLPLGMTAPAVFAPVQVPVADGTSNTSANTNANFIPPARYSSKVQAIPTISTADLLLMEAYANYDVEPVMKTLLQKLMVSRPEDVTGFALRTLAELHCQAGKPMPELPTGPRGSGEDGSVVAVGSENGGGGLHKLNPIISPRLQPGAGAI